MKVKRIKFRIALTKNLIIQDAITLGVIADCLVEDEKPVEVVNIATVIFPFGREFQAVSVDDLDKQFATLLEVMLYSHLKSGAEK